MKPRMSLRKPCGISPRSCTGTDLMLRFATIEPKAHAALDAAFRARSMVEPPLHNAMGKRELARPAVFFQ